MFKILVKIVKFLFLRFQIFDRGLVCNFQNLKKRRTDFFQDNPNAIRFNLVHLCPSTLLFAFAVFLLCCSTVLSGYLGVMKLHYFAMHSPFKC